MNKKANKKGFTLIELLAVIVVLALIMVLAMPSILKQSNNARKTTFRLFGQKVLDNAYAEVESGKILGATERPTCYTLADLGMTNTKPYEGFVTVSYGTDNEVTYTLTLRDGTWGYVNTPSTEVYGSNNTSITNSSKVTSVTCP